MTSLDALRLMSGVVWAVVFLLLLGSVVRSVSGWRVRSNDAAWGLPWAFAVYNLGYTYRWLLDWTHVPNSGGDFASLLGLHVLSVMIAVIVIGQRVALEGKRW